MPVVVLLHGLARTHRSLAGLRRHLEAAGFATWSESYPSRRRPIAELAADVARRVRAAHPGAELVAVTHSLGGILVRYMAPLLPWRGAVMIAPPNQGSRVARALVRRRLFRWFHGPAGQELAAPGPWPDPPRPFGVIAGTRSLSIANPVSWLTRGAGIFDRALASDGTVAVDETGHLAADDFVTVDASHTWLVDHPHVRAWVVNFLRTGRFGP